MKIPLLDIPRQLTPIRQEIDDAVLQVIHDAKFILGPNVALFENQVAEFCGTKHAIGVASGTDALVIALHALGIQPGDEVITTAYSFFATASCIWRVGARPVFSDILPDTFNIDPESVKQNITAKTKAILVVHLFGQMADMDQLREVAGDIPIIEDAAQSIGATWHDHRAGSIGLAGCFSFFPSKNLGGFGDGGMIVTSDESLAARSRSLRVHGSLKTYFHEEVGYNSRLDTIQAAVLSVKLKYLETWSAQRRQHAAFYDEAFKNTPVITPKVTDGAVSIYNQYVIRVPRRDELKSKLAQADIGHAIYYPLSLSLQPCFRSLNYQEGDLPESERASRESLALPIYSELRRDEAEEVVRVVKEHVLL